MKNLKKIIPLLMVTLLFSNCSKINLRKDENNSVIIFNNSYQTSANEADNIDSPTFYKLDSNNAWLISTAKSTNRLLVHNASNGDFIKYIGSKGCGQLEFLRPNGIFVIDSFLVVVERDNHRLQVITLPNLNFVTFIGTDELVKPYGIFAYKKENQYHFYITDNYETAEEQIPPNNELNKRVLHYQFSYVESIPTTKLIKKFGEIEGNGVLKIVESIWGDKENNNLLIAEEKKDETCVKVYDFDGNFKNQIIGKGLFKYQVEGIAFYNAKYGKGFWIITDQNLGDNTFHIFSRKDFNHIGSFKVSNTENTDGIWLTQNSFNNFPKGAFFSVNNDQNVSAVNLAVILKKFLTEKIEK